MLAYDTDDERSTRLIAGANSLALGLCRGNSTRKRRRQKKTLLPRPITRAGSCRAACPCARRDSVARAACLSCSHSLRSTAPGAFAAPRCDRPCRLAAGCSDRMGVVEICAAVCVAGRQNQRERAGCSCDHRRDSARCGCRRAAPCPPESAACPRAPRLSLPPMHAQHAGLLWPLTHPLLHVHPRADDPPRVAFRVGRGSLGRRGPSHRLPPGCCDRLVPSRVRTFPRRATGRRQRASHPALHHWRQLQYGWMMTRLTRRCAACSIAA